tara:strand:+ start:7984 stop:8130 length:147 start_codon:yes stop_codon:yes gene_type:complete
MNSPRIFNLIKTECGRAKYKELVKKEGVFNKIRLMWFIAIATIKDYSL